MKILCVIPCRGGSKGLPRKNALSIAGKPMLSYTINYIANSAYRIKTVVTTEDEEIAEIAKKLGVEVIPRDKSKQGDTAQCVDATHDAFLEVSKSGFVADTVIQMYASTPVRPPGVLDQALDLFATNERITGVFTIYPSFPYHPNHAVAMDKDGFITFPYGLPPCQRQALPPRYYLSSALYLFRREYISIERHPENLYSHFGPRIAGVVIDRDQVVDIDSQADLLKAEIAIKGKSS